MICHLKWSVGLVQGTAWRSTGMANFGGNKAKMAELIELPVGMISGVGPGNCVLDGHAHWRHQATMVEWLWVAVMSGFATRVAMRPVSKLLLAILFVYFYHQPAIHKRCTTVLLTNVNSGVDVCDAICYAEITWSLWWIYLGLKWPMIDWTFPKQGQVLYEIWFLKNKICTYVHINVLLYAASLVLVIISCLI